MSDVQANPQLGNAPIETPEATPTPAPVEKPDTSWVPRRISEITAARRAAEARVAEEQAKNQALEAELARLRAGGDPASTPTPTPAPNQNFDQLVAARAEAIAKQQRETDTMNAKIGEINETGAKEFGDDFEKSVQNLQAAGIGGPDFLKVLTNIDKAAAVVTWLGKNENMNEAMRLASLDPLQMGIEMAKLSGKAAKELAKPISKAPPPGSQLEGSSGGDGGEPDPKDTKKWMEWRNKNRKTKR